MKKEEDISEHWWKKKALLKSDFMICGCVNEKTKEAAIEAIKIAKKEGADLVELRIDKLQNPEDAAEIIKQSELPVIATCRPEGVTKRIESLEKAIRAGAAYVDIEIETAEKNYKKIAETARKNGCKVICSFHDFHGTPPKEELKKKIGEMEGKCDVIKVVTMAHGVEDGYKVLELLKGRKNIVAFSMGDVGRFTRIVCLLCGSPWTYCKIGEGTAAGQYTIKEMKEKMGEMK